MNTKKYSLVFVAMVMVLTSCGTGTTNIQTPKVGPLVPTGQVETVELGATVENVWNCGNGGGTIVKHPSRSISTNHSVEWEVGGTTGVGVTIGEGVVPGGVDLSASLEGHYRSQFDTGSQQSTSWDLPAEPNTIVDYTLIWREVWETGYIDVLINNSNKRVNVRYRTNIGSEMVGKQVKSCDGSVTIPEQPTQSTSVQPTQSVNVQPLSSFTQDDINRLMGSGNWHCIDGFPNSISIDNIPSGFVVQSPFVRIDRQDKFYYQGDIVLGNGYATGWLENNLPNNTCSLEQPQVTQASINGLIGAGNWYCLTDYPTGVKVRNVPSGFVVQSPAIMVDKNNIRYYKGQSVPSGGAATVWFANNVPQSECP